MKPVAPVRAMRGLAPTGFTAGLGRSVGVARQYSAFGSYGLHRRAAVLVWRALALRRWSAPAPPLSLQPGRARHALPLGPIRPPQGRQIPPPPPRPSPALP